MSSNFVALRRTCAAVALAVVATSAGCSGDSAESNSSVPSSPNPSGGESAGGPKTKLPGNNSVIDVANDEGNAGIVSAASKGELMEALGDESAEYTLLVPSDADLDALYAAHPDYRDDGGRASFLLKMHLIKGKFNSAELREMSGSKVSMASGVSLDVVSVDGVVKVGWVSLGKDLPDAENGKLISVEGVLAPELAGE